MSSNMQDIDQVGVMFELDSCDDHPSYHLICRILNANHNLLKHCLTCITIFHTKPILKYQYILSEHVKTCSSPSDAYRSTHWCVPSQLSSFKSYPETKYLAYVFHFTACQHPLPRWCMYQQVVELSVSLHVILSLCTKKKKDYACTNSQLQYYSHSILVFRDKYALILKWKQVGY